MNKEEIRPFTDEDGVGHSIIEDFDDKKITLSYYDIKVLRLLNSDYFLNEEEIRCRIDGLNGNLRTYIEKLGEYGFINSISDGESYMITPNGKTVLELLEND